MDNNQKEQQNFEHDNLTEEEEKEEAKQNGFILVGKTGVGKTTILNAIFNKVMISSRDAIIAKETKSCLIYYYKLTNGKVVCLVETPALTYIEETSKKIMIIFI